jgi:zinc transporter, ZIP family
MSISTLRTLIGLNGRAAPHWASMRAMRGVLGASIALFGLALLVLAAIPSDPAHLAAIRNAAIAGAATGLGALALLVMRKVDEKGLGLFIAIAAGMMAAAAIVSLFLPALKFPGAAVLVISATLAGYSVMAMLDHLLPHAHPVTGVEMRGTERNRMAGLMVIAIAIHNLPEGFAVGASVGQGVDGSLGTALSIGLQNIPEGLIVATALWSIGVNKGLAALAALGTGLIEPFGAVVGVFTAEAWPRGAPASMAFAAGAMAFVVINEMIPESMNMVGKLKTLYVTGLSTVLTAIALGWMGA